MSKQLSGATLPLLPLRNLVVFPKTTVEIYVGRKVSLTALQESSSNHDSRILIASQKDQNEEVAGIAQLHQVGGLAKIINIRSSEDSNTCLVLLESLERVKLSSVRLGKGEFFSARYSKLPSKGMSKVEARVFTKEKLLYSLKKLAMVEEESRRRDYLALAKSAGNYPDLEQLIDKVAALLTFDPEVQAEILAAQDLTARFEKALGLLKSRFAQVQLDRSLRERVKKQMELNQREYYLNEQAKAIQKELNKENPNDELAEYESKINSLAMSVEARDKCKRELVKLKSMPPISAETTVVRSYLDWMLKLPWDKRSKSSIDLKRCERILNRDHYGLDEVKERILEYLAVNKKVDSSKNAPVLCLLGPPGVGKTSLAKSIAEAVGREYVRFSLGGLRDESEIRGHRRTYIGSMPGKIIQNICKAGSNNPVVLLDEIDKMGADFRGDPGSALLEVLDPEQNSKFNDLYLEIDYDLSEVMFICTANSNNISQPLLDRMEVIRLSEYTEEEKCSIARSYLLPKQIKRHGFANNHLRLSEAAYRAVIRNYTREAGVRTLERQLAKILRKTAYLEAIGDKSYKSQLKSGKLMINPPQLQQYLGQARYIKAQDKRRDSVGVVTGLAWTMVGGDTLTIEALLLQGKGEVILTGSLGDVMKESIRTALSIVRSRAYIFKIDQSFHSKHDFHIHIPEGATPKDGPSAGVAICTALLSSLAGISVSSSVAMTGEVTLRGNILPVGGIKEKLLAAYREGIKTVLIPADNIADLQKIPDKIKDKLMIMPITRIEEALKMALVETPESIEWGHFPGLQHQSNQSLGSSDHSSVS